MAYINVINGNLLDATEEYIAHQCNCVSISPKGLALTLFNQYEHANTYKNHGNKKSIPGTIDVMGNIINMYAQYYPTISKYNNDSKEKRIVWFQSCLDKISFIDNIKSIAMPYNIGCGLAGGDWDTYYKMLVIFTEEHQIYITLYKI